MASVCIQRWAFFLSGFIYKIEHIIVSENLMGDSLFRLTSNKIDNNEGSVHKNSDTMRGPINDECFL